MKQQMRESHIHSRAYTAPSLAYSPLLDRCSAMEAGCENSSPLPLPDKVHGPAKNTSPPLHDFTGMSVSPAGVTRTPLHDFPPPDFATPTPRPPLKELAPAQAASPQRLHAVRTICYASELLQLRPARVSCLLFFHRLATDSTDSFVLCGNSNNRSPS